MEEQAPTGTCMHIRCRVNHKQNVPNLHICYDYNNIGATGNKNAHTHPDVLNAIGGFTQFEKKTTKFDPVQTLIKKHADAVATLDVNGRELQPRGGQHL